MYRWARRSEFTFCDWNVPVLVEPTGGCIGRPTHSQFIGFTRSHVSSIFVCSLFVQTSSNSHRYLDRVAGFNSTKMNFRRAFSINQAWTSARRSSAELKISIGRYRFIQTSRMI